MNLRDLNYLIAVADLQHFGKAADACFVSQPTLSTQLKKLEDELGVQLFERNNKQVLITPIGKEIVQKARVVLQEAQQLKDLAKLANDPFAGPFRLGTIPTVGPYLLPHIVPLIKHECPNLELYLYEDKTSVSLDMLKQGKRDAIILALPVDTSGCEVTELYNEAFYLALPSKHALNKKSSVSLKNLQDETLLLLEEGHCMRDQALEICHQVNIQQKSGFQATSLETLRHMVAAEGGITLLPELATLSSIPNQNLIKTKPFKKPIPKRQIGMIWRKNSAHKICSEKIASLIRDKIQLLIKKV